MRESEVDKAFAEALKAANLHWCVWRNPQPNPRTTRWGDVGCGGTGSADWHGCIRGQWVSIELKGEGGRQKNEQKDWQKRLERAGGLYYLCYAETIDNVIEALEEIRARRPR